MSDLINAHSHLGGVLFGTIIVHVHESIGHPWITWLDAFKWSVKLY